MRFRASCTQHASGAESSGFLSAPRGFPRSAEHGLCGAHYDLRSRLLGVTDSVFTMARGGRVSVLTTSAFAGCWRIPTSNCPAVLT